MGKKMLAMLLGVSMTISMLAGCGTGQDSDSAEDRKSVV